MKNIIILLSLLFFASCNKTEKTITPTETSCPLYTPMDRQEFVFQFDGDRPVPANVAITYNGVEKVNSCSTEIKQRPPIVSFGKYDVNPKLRIFVNHFGAFQELPQIADLKLVDLKDCIAAPQVVFEAESIPLEFTEKIVGPESCNIKEFNADIGILVN